MSEIKRYNGNGRYSEAVIRDGVIYLAGLTGDTPYADVTTQTEEMLAEVDRVLAAYHSDKEHILDAIIVLSDISTAAEMNKVWDAWVAPGHEPARMCCEGRLVAPAWRVEVKITAAVKD